MSEKNGVLRLTPANFFTQYQNKPNKIRGKKKKVASIVFLNLYFSCLNKGVRWTTKRWYIRLNLIIKNIVNKKKKDQKKKRKGFWWSSAFSFLLIIWFILISSAGVCECFVQRSCLILEICWNVSQNFGNALNVIKGIHIDPHIKLNHV